VGIRDVDDAEEAGRFRAKAMDVSVTELL